MNIANSVIYFSLTAIMVLTVFGVDTACIRSCAVEPAPYSSFREIPGVTGEEIAAIEALRVKGRPLIYAMLPSGEAFLHDGEICGFAAMYCRSMTDFFGIEFRLKHREWSDISGA